MLLVRLGDETTETIADVSESDAKMLPQKEGRRRHVLLDPDLPQIWSCVSSIPGQHEGPEIYRDDLMVMFCTKHSGTHLPDRCMFFCNCDRDTDGGKNVFGNFAPWESKHTQNLSLKNRNCGQCANPLVRETLRVAYWCTICNEKLCQMGAGMIPFDPIPRMTELVSTQCNLNHWCHDAADSQHWKTPAKTGCESNKRDADWTWDKLEADNVDKRTYVFSKNKGHKSAK